MLNNIFQNILMRKFLKGFKTGIHDSMSITRPNTDSTLASYRNPNKNADPVNGLFGG